MLQKRKKKRKTQKRLPRLLKIRVPRRNPRLENDRAQAKFPEENLPEVPSKQRHFLYYNINYEKSRMYVNVT